MQEIKKVAARIVLLNQHARLRTAYSFTHLSFSDAGPRPRVQILTIGTNPLLAQLAGVRAPIGWLTVLLRYTGSTFSTKSSNVAYLGKSRKGKKPVI
jgi:hypothetical protein